MGNSGYDVQGCFELISLFALTMLTTCRRYPVDVLLMVTSCHCYIVFNPDTHSSNSVEEDYTDYRLQITGNMTFTVCWHTAEYWIKRPRLFFNSHVFPSLLSDGGVWQSSLQKAPFPSGSVDQLAQETLCQTRGSLAKCYLCQVSLLITLVISCFASVSCTFVLRLCHFLVIAVQPESSAW